MPALGRPLALAAALAVLALSVDSAELRQAKGHK